MEYCQKNPWSVNAIEDFLYFCCPECDLTRESIYQSKKLFLKHVLDQHPKAKEYIPKLEIKDEPIDHKECIPDPEFGSLSYVETDYDLASQVKYEYEENQENGDQTEIFESEIKWYDSKTIKQIDVEPTYGFKCKTCDFVAKNKQALSKHSKIHRKCNKCGKVFISNHSKRNYETHIKSCTGEPIPTVHQCIKCQKVFQFRSYLKKHLKDSLCRDKTPELMDAKFPQKSEQNVVNFNNIPPHKIDSAKQKSETNQEIMDSIQTAFDAEVGESFAKKEPTEIDENNILIQSKFEDSEEEVYEDSNKKSYIKYGCKVCGKSFKFIQYLKDHINFVHEGKKSHICETCGEAFGYKGYLSIHIKNSHNVNSNTESLKCENCTKTFPNLHRLQLHINVIHEGKRDHKCDMCSKAFGYKGNLRKHIREVHAVLRSCICDLCGKSYKSGDALKSHIKHFHEGKKTEYKFNCDICGKAYKSRAAVRNHIEHFHKGKKREKKFTCEVCGQAFHNKRNLQDHVNYYHEKNKNYECDLCGKAFQTKGQIKTHVSTYHEGLKEFECEQCGKCFTTRSGLTHHQKIIHEGQRNSKCDLCGKCFQSQQYLNHHISSVHEGKRNFSCEHCEKTFAHREGMKNHVKTVHEGIRYQCDYCEKSFTQLPNLKSHIKGAHVNCGK